MDDAGTDSSALALAEVEAAPAPAPADVKAKAEGQEGQEGRPAQDAEGGDEEADAGTDGVAEGFEEAQARRPPPLQALSLPIVAERNLPPDFLEEDPDGDAIVDALARITHLRADRERLCAIEEEALRACAQVRNLYVQCNALTTLAPVRNLPNLRFLSAADNQLVDWDGLAGLANLMFVDTARNRFEAYDVGQLPKSVRFLMLEGNPAEYSAQLLADLRANLPNIAELDGVDEADWELVDDDDAEEGAEPSSSGQATEHDDDPDAAWERAVEDMVASAQQAAADRFAAADAAAEAEKAAQQLGRPKPSGGNDNDGGFDDDSDFEDDVPTHRLPDDHPRVMKQLELEREMARKLDEELAQERRALERADLAPDLVADMDALRAAVDTGMLSDPSVDPGAAVDATMQDARRRLQRQRDGIMAASRMRVEEARESAGETDQILDDWKETVRKPPSRQRAPV